MKKLQTIGLVALLLSVVPASAFVVPSDVAAVTDMITDDATPFMFKEETGEEEVLDLTVVFKEGGMRYTARLMVRDASEDDRVLTFSIRKDGSTAPTLLQTVSDVNADGEVDYGMDGMGQKVFQSANPDDAQITPTGSEHKAYWQEQYNAAIVAAINYKKRMSK